MKIETHEMVEEFQTHTNGCGYHTLFDTDNKEAFVDYGCNHYLNLQTGAGKYIQSLLRDNKDRPLKFRDLPLLEDWQRVYVEVVKINPCKYCGHITYLNTEALEKINQERVKNYR